MVQLYLGRLAKKNLFWNNSRDFYLAEQVAVVVYILTDGIDDASGIDNNTALKIPIEATEDTCSALKHDRTSVNSYKATLLYSASSSASGHLASFVAMLHLLHSITYE